MTTTNTDTSNDSNAEEFKSNAETLRVIKKIGYTNGTKLTDTLQGSIWKIYKTSPQGQIQTAVLKSASKSLHRRSAAIINGRECKVEENIFNEQRILKYLTHHKHCPRFIVKFRRFFKTHTHYYLLMGYGGESLFDLIVQAHQLIATGHLDRSEWMSAVHVILKQTIECIDYLHSRRVCHFDISLDNFVINDVLMNVDDQPNTKRKVRFVLDNIQVKLCDFGLAHLFDQETDFQSHKCYGKTQYASPESLRRSGLYDAKKNDVWAYGICLFIMIFGCPPWTVANDTDECFVYVKRNSLNDLLKHWDMVSYANKHLLCLLNSIFQCECDRICLKHIQQYMR